MCGITGFIDFNRQTPPDTLRDLALSMATSLRHRGPDDRGVWIDAAAGIALGHQRLSIVDLSSAGRQPMQSTSGRYVLVYNGEVYNSQDLRNELAASGGQAFRFCGHSDTEVVLACIERWGLQDSLERFNGMFAFALWDQHERILYLCRDRIGEKPLYYGWFGRTFLFGSELKALRAHPSLITEINRDALALYLRYSNVPAPQSIFRGVHKLPAGTLLVVDGKEDQKAEPVPYWSLGNRAGTALPCSEAETLERLEALLRESVRIRMLADVPVGAFLSGGVDSSLVTALMQAQTHRAVRTFSIGLREPDYNEAHYAADVARHLGTDHTELYVTANDAQAVIPLLPTIYDEPFADSSQIPTFLLSRMARPHVTVALSGDGGDELFGGYNRHVWGGRIERLLGWSPIAARRVASSVITAVGPESWDSFFRVFQPILGKYGKHRIPGYKMHKLASILRSTDGESTYLEMVSHWTSPVSVVIGAREPRTLLAAAAGPNLASFTERMMYWDALTYLPDDILTKLDRASMAVSLETRIPLLDHRVVEFASLIPVSMKVRSGRGKWILRHLLHRFLPSWLIDRPKTGFGIPLNVWLRGPLRDWAEALLDERRIRRDGFLDPQPIRKKWRDFLSSKGAWQYHLWDVLMFQAWFSEQRRRQPQIAASFVATA